MVAPDESFKRTFRPIMEEYPLDTCSVCLERGASQELDVGLMPNRYKAPVCTVCNDEWDVSETTIEWRGKMLSKAERVTYREEVDEQLDVSEHTVFELGEDEQAAFTEACEKVKDEFLVIGEHSATGDRVGVISNDDHTALLWIDKGHIIVLDELPLEKEGDQCCIRHTEWNSLSDFLYCFIEWDVWKVIELEEKKAAITRL